MSIHAHNPAAPALDWYPCVLCLWKHQWGEDFISRFPQGFFPFSFSPSLPSHPRPVITILFGFIRCKHAKAATTNSCEGASCAVVYLCDTLVPVTDGTRDENTTDLEIRAYYAFNANKLWHFMSLWRFRCSIVHETATKIKEKAETSHLCLG